MLNAALLGAIAAAGQSSAQPADLPILIDGLQGWISTTRGRFLFADGSAFPGNGKRVREARHVADQALLFDQVTAALQPTWDNLSFDVPCIRSDGTQYLVRNSALPAPGLVIATVALDAGVSGFRAITGARSTQTPGGDPAEDAWTLTRTNSAQLQGLAATSAGVSFATTPEILGEKLIVMVEIVGNQLQVWQAGMTGAATLAGTRIASNGEQVLLAKYYNDAITAILQGCLFDFAQYSPAPSRAERRLLVQYFQALLWPATSPPVAATVAAGQVARAATKSVDVVTPSAGQSLVLASIDEQPGVGTASTAGNNVAISVPGGAALGNYSLRYCLRSNVIGARLVDFGRVDFEVIQEGAAEVPDLPFFGQYYGNVLRGNVGDSHLDKSDSNGVFAFFFAERTGVVTAFNWYARYNNDDGTYSQGNGGTYTIEIRPASAATKMPLAGPVICQRTGYQPFPSGVPAGSGQAFFPEVAFTTTGQLVAKQPYALIVRNTSANPALNYVSQNSPLIYAFDDDSDPANYAEPGDGVGGAILPQNVSGSIAPVRGWHPVRIDGTLDLYPQPAIYRVAFRYRRVGQPMLAELIYSDGQRMNWGSWGAEHSYALPVEGTNQVRERFRVTRATRVVSGVFIRVSRHNGSGGNCVVTLESGPSSDTSGNGSATFSPISVPASNFLDVGANFFNIERWDETSQAAPYYKVHWVWVPFPSNQTLTLGSVYTLRLSASGGFDGKCWCAARAEQQGLSPRPPQIGDNWDDYIANRKVCMNAWEDSRGVQSSTNDGSTWAFFGSRRMAPILFKCV
jgi:hypothetical protein